MTWQLLAWRMKIRGKLVFRQKRRRGVCFARFDMMPAFSPQTPCWPPIFTPHRLICRWNTNNSKKHSTCYLGRCDVEDGTQRWGFLHDHRFNTYVGKSRCKSKSESEKKTAKLDGAFRNGSAPIKKTKCQRGTPAVKRGQSETTSVHNVHNVKIMQTWSASNILRNWVVTSWTFGSQVLRGDHIILWQWTLQQ